MSDSSPRWARFLLSAGLPRHRRENLIGDLEEELRLRLAEGFSRRAARSWYWRQSLSLLFHYSLRSFERRLRPTARRSRSWGGFMFDLRLALRALRKLLPRNSRPVFALGRLRSGVDLRQAQAEMDRIAERLQEEHLSHRRADLRIRLAPLQEDLREGLRATLLLAFAAVGLLLLVAATNVANLSLVRALGRRRELAIRGALGAGRWRLLRHVLAENVVLALLGGAFGVLVAYGALDFFLAVWAEHAALVETARIDAIVLGVTVLISLVTGIVFGLLPAIRASRTDPQKELREGGRSGTSWRRQRAQRLLVLAEVAVSLALLIGAGLVLRTSEALGDVRPGFEARGVLTLRFSLPEARYPAGESRASFVRDVVESVESLGAVEDDAAGFSLPLATFKPAIPYTLEEARSEGSLRRIAD